jgi:hypothetical protein
MEPVTRFLTRILIRRRLGHLVIMAREREVSAGKSIIQLLRDLTGPFATSVASWSRP